MSLDEGGDMKAHEEAGYKIPLEPEKNQLINQPINQWDLESRWVLFKCR